ncbi:MAG: flagellar basal body P-ring formation chaperone FlgA [Bdellovibrionota bacterium]
MKLFFAALLALSLSPLAPAVAAKSSLVTVRAVVEIEEARTDVTLGDLVTSHGMSRTARERLSAIRLADAPKPGESRTFTDTGLADVFKPSLETIEKETGEKFELRIPSHVSVSKKRLRLDAAAIEDALKKGLKGLCAECEFQISNLNTPTIGSVLGADTEWQIRFGADVPRGSFSLPVEVTQASGAKRTYWISGSINVLRPVPVAARAISIGEKIQAEDIVIQKKDVTYTNDTPISEAELGSSVAARQIAAGQIVWKASARRELAIKYGDTVKVTAGSEEWQIMIDGVAQNSGYVGDLIRVKIPRTQKTISGLLRSKGMVEVQ